MTALMNPEKIEELEEYLRSDGRIKKDCWLNEMQMRYNHYTDKYELADSISTSAGERILGVRESYSSLREVPYAGTWIKCDEKGKPIDECDQIVGEG